MMEWGWASILVEIRERDSVWAQGRLISCHIRQWRKSLCQDPDLLFLVVFSLARISRMVTFKRHTFICTYIKLGGTHLPHISLPQIWSQYQTPRLYSFLMWLKQTSKECHHWHTTPQLWQKWQYRQLILQLTSFSLAVDSFPVHVTLERTCICWGIFVVLSALMTTLMTMAMCWRKVTDSQQEASQSQLLDYSNVLLYYIEASPLGPLN